MPRSRPTEPVRWSGPSSAALTQRKLASRAGQNLRFGLPPSRREHRVEQPWELAYARYRHAEADPRERRSRGRGDGPLREAHAVASNLGAAPLRIAIEALASRARIQLESQPGSDEPEVTRPATTLTGRELEVLALVAAGHTNREIGDRLFISEKTASVHVTHAMNKLGALSRYEAAAVATRQGLLEPERRPAN